MEAEMANFKPGDKVFVSETPSRKVAAIIMREASYVGKSGPGYYASYDPPVAQCSSFWVHDRILELRQ